MPWTDRRQLGKSGPTGLERVISGVCYLTMGFAGILYIIISGSRSQSQFFRHHFLQAIVLGILGLILNWSSGAFLSILAGIFGLFGGMGGMSTTVLSGLAEMVSLICKAGYLLLLYGAVLAFLGRFAEIPLISNLVRRQM